MSDEFIDYPQMIDAAMRDVVRDALDIVESEGLPGDHHFYVSFKTLYPGVSISKTLLDRYPEEMTIVVQHQYWDLKVEDEKFSITLSFNNVPEKLVVPFASITAFADPSVKFGLQFHVEKPEDEDDDEIGIAENVSLVQDTKIETPGAKVISLENFRKK